MNKAVMIAINPKWMKMIESGEKEFEFRDYAIPKGTKVYLYESKGKKIRHEERQQPYGELIHEWYEHEGRGAVVSEFVVGECTDIFNDLFPYLNGFANTKWMDDTGFVFQKYMLDIKDLIVYDKEWLLDKEVYIEDYSSIGEKEHDSVAEYYSKVLIAPTKPIPVTEFIGWNKFKQWYNDYAKKCINSGSFPPMDYEQARQLCYQAPKEDYNKFKLNNPPQGKIYVVEREE